MAECTHLDLRKAREARDWPRWKLAQEVGVSEDTVERWETGKSMPTPDDVDRIGEAVGDPQLWHRWMLSNVDSYRKRYIDATDLSLPVALQRLSLEIQDVQEMYNAVARDALDGKIDNQQLRKEYQKQLRELTAAVTDALNKL